MTNEKKIWSYLMQEIANPFGVAGLMGNIKAESNFDPCNLQNSYEKKFGYTDDTYTQAVDNGEYTRDQFCNDHAGYGLCQWTYWSRKQSLYDTLKRYDASIGDLFSQLSFMIDELRAYRLLDKLKTAKSVKEASDLILTQYEKPADQSENAKKRRAEIGQAIYDNNVNSTPQTHLELSALVTALELAIERDIESFRKSLDI